jgi:hypothetical protein
MRSTSVQYQFVDQIPNALEQGILYVSMQREVAVHLCASGCGKEVVTALGAGEWSLLFDGAVTLRPSIGNEDYDCGSHYWITRGQIIWVDARGARPSSPTSRPIAAGRFAGLPRRLMAWLRGGRG